jgi:ubiquinone biosynthesis protein COQ9
MNPVGSFKEWLEGHLDELKEKNPTKKAELNNLYQRVTIAYEQSLNSALTSNNKEIAAITEQLSAIQEDVTRRIERAEDIGDIINKIATGVDIATKIASFLIKK